MSDEYDEKEFLLYDGLTEEDERIAKSQLRAEENIKHVRRWQRENRERYNQYQRQYQQKRNAVIKARAAVYLELEKLVRTMPNAPLAKAWELVNTLKED